MIEYSIKLRESETDFLSENFDALFFLDAETYNPPETSPERLEAMMRYYNSVNAATRNNFEVRLGITNPENPILNKLMRQVEIHRAKTKFDINSRSSHLVRSLYGILGFEKIMGYNGWDFHNYFVPEENWEATKGALRNDGTFSKKFSEEDLEVLRFVFKRNSELRELGIKNRYPLFYISEISRISGVPRQNAEKTLKNLTGLLGFCHENHMQYGACRWFVPKAREKLIREIIS